MTLQSLQCPHCGAILSITNSTKVAHCEFCDSDIMIEQPQNQQNIPLQQYAEQKIPPEFVTRNDMPLQPYQKQNLNAGQQSPYYPPAGRTDEYAFQQWKTKSTLTGLMKMDFQRLREQLFLHAWQNSRMPQEKLPLNTLMAIPHGETQKL